MHWRVTGRARDQMKETGKLAFVIPVLNEESSFMWACSVTCCATARSAQKRNMRSKKSRLMIARNNG
jgi:hypothetical protein